MYLQPPSLREPPCLERGLREHDVFTALITQKAAMLREELRELDVFTALRQPLFLERGLREVDLQPSSLREPPCLERN